MGKTTKRVVPVRSIQRFKNDGVKSVTIEGATGLADVDTTPQGDFTLTMKRDTTKVDKTVFDTAISKLVARIEALELKTKGQNRGKKWVIHRLTNKSIPILWIELKGDIKEDNSFEAHIHPTLRDDIYMLRSIQKICVSI